MLLLPAQNTKPGVKPAATAPPKTAAAVTAAAVTPLERSSNK